jgi:Na+/phosphate symporter
MKTIIFAFTLSLFVSLAFAQTPASKKSVSSGIVNIDVPKFDNPAATEFYEAYTAHIKKAVTAIRNKDEAGWKNLVKDEKDLNEKEKQALKTKLTPADMKRKQAYLMQAMPYLQEIDQSAFNRKLNRF